MVKRRGACSGSTTGLRRRQQLGSGSPGQPPPAEVATPADMPADIGQLVRTQVTAALQRADTLDLVVQAITDSVTTAVLEKLQSTIELNQNKVSALQKSLDEANEKLRILEKQTINRSDELEQYQRRNNIRVFGVPEEHGENTDEVFLKIAREKLGVHLSELDIDRSHRVGRRMPDSRKPRPIIIKFVSYRKRSEVFDTKKKLAKSGITLREDLTSERMKVLKSAISQYGLHNVWTRDGTIIVKTGAEKHSVSNDTELRSIM